MKLIVLKWLNLSRGGSITESPIHLAIKHWIAEKYIATGISRKNIKYEKTFYGVINDRHTASTPDVFINANGGIAIFCQLRNGYTWFHHFFNTLKFVQTYSKKQVVVFPENLEMLYPIRFQDQYTQFSENNIEVFIAPCSVDIENKSKVRIDMTYNALQKLCKFKNKFNPDKPLMEFIERDLEKIIK